MKQTQNKRRLLMIVSLDQVNAEAEKALAQYAIKGNEFTYLRVGDEAIQNNYGRFDDLHKFS